PGPGRGRRPLTPCLPSGWRPVGVFRWGPRSIRRTRRPRDDPRSVRAAPGAPELEMHAVRRLPGHARREAALHRGQDEALPDRLRAGRVLARREEPDVRDLGERRLHDLLDGPSTPEAPEDELGVRGQPLAEGHHAVEPRLDAGGLREPLLREAGRGGGPPPSPRDPPPPPA